MLKPRVAFALTIIWISIAVAGIAADQGQVEREHFIYDFSNPNQIDFADSVLNSVRAKVAIMLGSDLPYKPSIYIVDDLTRFKRLTRGLIPDWGAAAAFPERELIAIKSPDQFNLGHSLAELLAHEYAHLALAARCGFQEPPRWLNEGMAMYVSTEWGWANNLAMSRASVFGQLVPLKEIELVNRFGEGKAQVAYSQSYLAFEYFMDQYGIAPLNVLLDSIAVGKSIDVALVAATGSNYAEFETEYASWMEKRYNIVSLFMDTMLFWVGLALIVVIGSFVRYKRRRRYYKKWEQEDRYQSRDFDYGDPERPEEADDDEPWRS